LINIYYKTTSFSHRQRWWAFEPRWPRWRAFGPRWSRWQAFGSRWPRWQANIPGF